LVDDLHDFSIQGVFADGRLVAETGDSLIPVTACEYPNNFFTTMQLEKQIAPSDLYLTTAPGATQARVVVMNLAPSQIRTREDATLPVKNGRILPVPEQDLLYISVTDRHSGAGGTASGLIKGFGLKQGAFATSLSPDDDNVICIGASVSDMALAINHLFNIGGGQVVVDEGRLVADIRLPICGIMADVSAREMAEKEKTLRECLFARGVTVPKPFFSILFLSITAIPELAITDKGLVDAATRQFIDPVLSWS
jgi:adenine deaminase